MTTEISIPDSESHDEDTDKEFEFVNWGPPPDLKRRELIFDSLNQVITKTPAIDQRQQADEKPNRGTHVFTWGAGYNGQLGRKFVRGQKKYSTIPTIVHMNVVIRQITCGGRHTAVVTDAGKVYTWGDGRNGQLGHSPDTFTIQATPLLVEALQHVFIVQVACGKSHTVALSDKGMMYSWGFSKFGQTGQGDRQIVKVPRKIETDRRDFDYICCGEKHTMAIARNGEVYSFGSNEHGQIGQGTQSDFLKPTVIELTEQASQDEKSGIKMKMISCGTIHSALLSEDGRVFLCGFGEYFFPDDKQHFYLSPVEVPTKEPMKQLACGQSHVISLSESGNVYTWGRGEYGQLGYGVKGNISTPRLILRNKNIAQVAAGRYHSFAVSSNGILFSWGCGENGQLGHDSDENVLVPKTVDAIAGAVVGQISCGEHHSACVTSAPWGKITQDVLDLLRYSREEYDLSLKHIKKSSRGLTVKDLNKVEEEALKWKEEYEQLKEKQSKEEKEDYEKDLQQIRGKGTLLDDIMKGFMNKAASQLAALPSVEKSPSEEALDVDKNENALVPSKGNVTRKSRSFNKGMARLPLVSPKHSGGDNENALVSLSSSGGSNSNALNGSNDYDKLPNIKMWMKKVPQSARSGSSEGNRKGTHSSGSSTQRLVPTQQARTAFLKETSQNIRKYRSIVAQKGENATKQQLQKSHQMVFSLRKEYDSLKSKREKLQKKHRELSKEQELLESSTRAMIAHGKQCYEKLHALEMQLDTVTIKIAETEENRNNYDLNIAHLKEEEFEHFNELEGLRKQLSDINTIYKKLNEHKIQAFEERDRAEAELAEFMEEIKNYKTFVNNQLGMFNQVLDANDKRTKSEVKDNLVKSKKKNAKSEAKMKELTNHAHNTDQEAKQLSDELKECENKLRIYEQKFQEITAATGLSDPESIINKFFFKGEIRDQLEYEIREKEKTLKELKLEHDVLTEKLENSKLGFRNKKWRDVNEMEERNRKISNQYFKSQIDSEKMIERVAIVQEGLLNLLAMTNQSTEKIDEEKDGAPLDESYLWNVEKVEETFDKILKWYDDITEKKE